MCGAAEEWGEGRGERERETAADTGEVIPDSCVARAGIKGVAGP